MGPDNRTKIFYEDNKSEILNRQLEQYHHNEKIALRFIVGLGVTTGLSALSSFVSLLIGNQQIVDLIDSFWNSGLGFSGQSNVLIGTMFLIVSAFLFAFALGKFWKVLNTPNPVPLLGNQSFGTEDIDLQVDRIQYRISSISFQEFSVALSAISDDRCWPLSVYGRSVLTDFSVLYILMWKNPLRYGSWETEFPTHLSGDFWNIICSHAICRKVPF